MCIHKLQGQTDSHAVFTDAGITPCRLRVNKRGVIHVSPMKERWSEGSGYEKKKLLSRYQCIRAWLESLHFRYMHGRHSGSEIQKETIDHQNSKGNFDGKFMSTASARLCTAPRPWRHEVLPRWAFGIGIRKQVTCYKLEMSKPSEKTAFNSLPLTTAGILGFFALMRN